MEKKEVDSKKNDDTKEVKETGNSNNAKTIIIILSSVIAVCLIVFNISKGHTSIISSFFTTSRYFLCGSGFSSNL